MHGPGAARGGSRACDHARQRAAGRPPRAPGGGLRRGQRLSVRHPRRPDSRDDRLPPRARATQPAATRTRRRHAGDHGARGTRRSRVRGPDQVRRTRLREGRGGRSCQGAGLDGEAGRRRLASCRALAAAARDRRARPGRPTARLGLGGHLRRRRWCAGDPRPVLGPTRRRRGRGRQGPYERRSRDRPGRRPAGDRDGRRRGLRGVGWRTPAGPGHRASRPARGDDVPRRLDGPEGRSRLPVRP